MKAFRKFQQWIYNIINFDRFGKNSALSNIYILIMLAVSVISIIPFFWAPNAAPEWVNKMYEFDYIVVILFSIDYVLRWLVADQTLDKGKKSFLLYPFTWWAIFDLLTILPIAFPTRFQVFLVFRIFRLFRFMPLFPRVNASLNFLTKSVLRNSNTLWVVFISLALLIITFSLVLLHFEGGQSDDPRSIKNFGDAVWFSFITIFTIGYGDYAVFTNAGKVVTTIMAIIGAINVALVTAIVVDGFNQSTREIKENMPELQKIIKKHNIGDGSNKWYSLVYAMDIKNKTEKQKTIDSYNRR